MSAMRPVAVSAMDGYALRTVDFPANNGFRLVGESAAGHGYAGTLKPGEMVRIFTGADVLETRFDAMLLGLPVLGRLIRDLHAARMARTLAPIDPRCTGMCGALAISWPSALNSAHEKSSRSLMLTE